MSDDVHALRCAELATPVTELMAAVLTAQGGAKAAFEEVERLAAQVRDIAAKGALGIDQADYVSWAEGAPAVLGRMIEAAEQSDKRGVWEAFADPQFGLHRIGAACAGQPRW